MAESNTSTKKKLEDLYELIDDMQIAMLTTQRGDGLMVTRPMATQKQEKDADLWFVTSIETHKVDEIRKNPNVCLGYYKDGTKEWVSVSGTATISQDRARIHELYAPDWKIWFEDEGGNRNGGPDDPRLALIFVEAKVVDYMKAKFSKPRVLFEIAKGFVTGDTPELGREEHLSSRELS